MNSGKIRFSMVIFQLQTRNMWKVFGVFDKLPTFNFFKMVCQFVPIDIGKTTVGWLIFFHFPFNNFFFSLHIVPVELFYFLKVFCLHFSLVFNDMLLCRNSFRFVFHFFDTQLHQIWIFKEIISFFNRVNL